MDRDVILITVDSLRADRVGVTTPKHATNRNLTPNIDELGNQGTICTDAFTTGPGTRQAFPGILSSSPPLAFGGYNRFSKERPSLAERLKNVGYTTSGVHSNAQLSSEFGYQRGFDDFYDLKNTSRDGKNDNAPTTEEMEDRSITDRIRDGMGKRIESHPEIYRRLKEIDIRINGVTRPYTSATETRKRALDWLRTHEDPTFLWIHFMDVHVPYYPPKKFREEVNISISDLEMGKLWLKLNATPESITEQELQKLKKLYDATVRYIDFEVGQFLSDVRETVRNDPIIVFVSDHGDEFREHGGLTHSPKLYSELVHVPLIFDLPEFDEDVVTQPTSTMDIGPTLLAAVDGDTEGCWGIDLQSRDRTSTRTVFSEVSQSPDNDKNRMNVEARISAGRTERWTYIRDDLRDEIRLFDRQKDMCEQHPCEEEYPKVVQRMEDEISAFRDRVDETSPELHGREMSPEIENRLKQLGYL